MMKSINHWRAKLYFLIAMSFASLPSFSYVIYNQTGHVLYVYDGGSPSSGLREILVPGQRAPCNPTARGCYGDISFLIYSTGTDHSHVVCSLDIYLHKGEKGHYFIITKTGHIRFPEPVWCTIHHYRD